MLFPSDMMSMRGELSWEKNSACVLIPFDSPVCFSFDVSSIRVFSQYPTRFCAGLADCLMRKRAV